MNNFGILDRDFEEVSKKVSVLDLTISIIPFSRGGQAHHFEILFVTFYSQIVSTYDAERFKILQVEPIS